MKNYIIFLGLELKFCAGAPLELQVFHCSIKGINLEIPVERQKEPAVMSETNVVSTDPRTPMYSILFKEMRFKEFL